MVAKVITRQKYERTATRLWLNKVKTLISLVQKKSIDKLFHYLVITSPLFEI